MRDEVDEQHTFNMISNTYPLLYTPQVTPHQEVKRRRRRRKAKSGGDDGEGMGKKRKLSEEQVSMLESSFGCEHKLESKRKDQLASEIGLDPRQVAVWFQNRRARWKSKRLEEEYSKLRASHETTLLEKCSLENEMLKLKEQLEEAQREIQRLTTTERGEIGSSNSPSSSLTTMDAAVPHASVPHASVMQMQLQGEYNELGGGSFQCSSPFYLEDTCIPSYEWNLYSL